MFGYTVLPTRVLDDLLARLAALEGRVTVLAAEALRQVTAQQVQQALAVSAPAPAATGPSPRKATAAAPAAPTPTLPADVLAACERYAWSPEELAANLAKAETLTKAGQRPPQVIRAIQAGADVDALFVG